MGSVEVVELLPFLQFGLQNDVAFVTEQLIEILSIRPVWSLHLAIQLWGATFDIGVADPKIFDVSVELSLELVTIVSSDFTNAEWELFNDMIDEVYCISLSVLLICRIQFRGTLGQLLY